MALSPLAGKPAPKELLIDPLQIEREYYSRKPDPADPTQRVTFGTSGHRGSPLTGRSTKRTSWPSRRRSATTGGAATSQGRSTWAGYACRFRSGQRTALEVLAGNGVATVIQRGDGLTPTPAISRAILVHNRGRADRLATASSSRHRTIRRRTVASSTTRPTADRPIVT
jgi:phosphoglucomutase